MPTPSYREHDDAQAPAMELLASVGYTPLTPDEALVHREDSRSRVLLTGVLEQQLHRLNEINYKGDTYAFSDENIYAAIEALRSVPDRGVVATNEAVYDLLTLGKSFEQNIQGDRKSFQLHYIDWAHPERNVYHVVPEFAVDGRAHTRRPDLVLFVNGIPLVVIECKRRDKDGAVAEGISQMLRNQKREPGIPKLFHYAQIVISAQPNKVKYATAGTEEKFWAYWKEPDTDPEAAVGALLDRLPTGQDKVLYGLCRPERLLELTYQFVVFDAGTKKIARWQQYFGVQSALERVKKRRHDGRRRGGVIWHTQGSGKSLTMVLLAKALTLDADIENPRAVIVTDRVDLDEQIWKTFRACGKEPQQATSGTHLLELLQDPGNAVITTLVHKFDAALNAHDYTNPSDNIFLLIDEVHRTQYGSLHARMKKTLPQACTIGFTGTPLTKQEKNTARKFDGFIDPTYTIRQAVDDEAVMPLLYEGRHVEQKVYKKYVDRDYERVTEPLNDAQREELARRFSTEDAIFASNQVLEEVVYNIESHYTETWQSTPFKGQIAAPSKSVALQLKDFFDAHGTVDAEVIISSPDTRTGHTDVYKAAKEKEQAFWDEMMRRYGSKDNYEETIIGDFKSAGGVELLIVVDKLLTGFDAPRNTVLYITKKMSGHTLLQAIARVNRPFPGKDYGFIIDYRGILGELNEALTEYDALADFDAPDLEGALHTVREAVDDLPQKHAAVWRIFKGIDRDDIEAMERHLADEKRRDDFFERLSAFGRTLQVALSSERFHQTTPESTIERYTRDLRFFDTLRKAVKNRYYDTVDFKAYESRIRKLVDQHVAADDVNEVVATVDILSDAFREEVERETGSVASKADKIAFRMKRIATEKMDEDPAFYRAFSEQIQETIDAFHNKRQMEAEAYLREVEARQDQLRDRGSDVPAPLVNQPDAQAYYGTVRDVLSDRETGADVSGDVLAQAGLRIANIIEELKIVDWAKTRNPDVEKDMRNEIEDALLAMSCTHELELSFDEIDLILDEALQIARTRNA